MCMNKNKVGGGIRNQKQYNRLNYENCARIRIKKRDINQKYTKKNNQMQIKKMCMNKNK